MTQLAKRGSSKGKSDNTPTCSSSRTRMSWPTSNRRPCTSGEASLSPAFGGRCHRCRLCSDFLSNKPDVVAVSSILHHTGAGHSTRVRTIVHTSGAGYGAAGGADLPARRHGGRVVNDERWRPGMCRGAVRRNCWIAWLGRADAGNVTVDSSMVTSSKTPREKNALWQKKRVK